MTSPVTICSPDNFPGYLSQSKPQLFVRPTSGLREAALGAEEVVSDHKTLPGLVTAKGTEGSTRPRAISLWAGGGPGLVLTGKDQLPQGMGILAARKLSGWHQLLKLKASEEITLRLHQTKRQAKVMNGEKKKR